MPDTSQNNRLEKREALDLALFHKLTSGDPESFVSQFFVLLAHVMKHSGNGSQPPQLGELAAHLAELKKSEALKASQAPEIAKYLEQLNATQGDILKRLRTLPASPAGGETWGKAPGLAGRHWPRAPIARIPGRLTTQRRAGERPRGCCDCCDADLPRALPCTWNLTADLFL